METSMTKKQAVNPYLPLNQYVPDGEPHVFGDRVYVYGSHDQEGGDAFCVLDYEVFSALVDDLGNWQSEGIAYRKVQDPDHSEKYRDMYAPDAVRGNDGKYYLYYAFAGGCFTGPIHVAVSDKPGGPFEYHGSVRNADGSVFNQNITFDPAVINDDGVIRMYYGWSLGIDPQQLPPQMNETFQKKLVQVQMMMFEKTEEEVRNTPEGIMGANVVELEDDMLTVKGEPKRIAPGQFGAAGTSFEGHAFYEGSSIRKVNDTYYFIYSSQWNHELCYATSKYPDRDFVYGGVIISNGDIGYQGRKAEDRLAATGNNHGSIECINGEWYIFYHRQTHKTTFSRQGCAEKIEILSDGSIPQVEMTSCGLNGGPLKAEGTYPAAIACNLTNGAMPHIKQNEIEEGIPYITHEGEEHFITDITDGTMIGYKYFDFNQETILELAVRGEGGGRFEVYADEEKVGEIALNQSAEWTKVSTRIPDVGVRALYLKYVGAGTTQLKEIAFTSISA